MTRWLSTASKIRNRRVVVTGMGVVSPLGVGLKNSWKSLIDGKSGIKKLDREEYEKLPCRIGGLVPRGNGPTELNIDSHFSKGQLRTMSMATVYALVASEEALNDASWKPVEEKDKEETGVAVGVGMIDLVDVCDTNDALKKGYSKVSPYFVPRILPNMAAGQISIKYGFRGPNHAVSTACATGAHAIGDAFRFVRGGDANLMVCGGAEACISPLAIAAFCRLRALSTSRNESPQEASRPFDNDRDGFVMGEGSAILVLEELEHALERNARIYAEVLGYGLSGDGAHLTAPREDGSGAFLAMRRAMNDACIELGQVSYVNAHATSTPLGDAIEVKAIQSLFCEHSENLMISSTKGAHGHLLGAAGNLEAVFTVMAIKEGLVPPTINLNHPNCESKINFVRNFARKWEGTSRRIALKNAFGFGGTNASLCIAQYIH
ncbi:3-oxoacyl-[acyl-carrier-protein] synthase, mitochondrial [Neodiprion lecontei]|uniref:3-oxoacyl-[acyl-carrier-protein] synthase n=1 Tax=Neodiprion lecontei TaxID=441921 RepID=A0A6J0BMW1_NEOLC|nr:3-oxoacyl-[acyl-carrier-protein] synthase, mitochondrial [Neodiprion lecontei]XP_046597033.1 3-oxoacyl-[acyl-carrier-protein] synthase, mitochondrial [Neodiprion lecontei]